MSDQHLVLIIFPGLPTTTALAGTSLATTAPAPMIASSPMLLQLSRIIALLPIQTLAPIFFSIPFARDLGSAP
ncbi:hypothetical protein D3C87_1932980 [compost metagenome]